MGSLAALHGQQVHVDSGPKESDVWNIFTPWLCPRGREEREAKRQEEERRDGVSEQHPKCQCSDTVHGQR